MSLPRGWNDFTLGDLLDKPRAGKSVNCENREKRAGEVGVLKTSAITSGYLHIEEHKVPVDSEVTLVKTPLRKDTILICRKNTPQIVGTSVYVDQDHKDIFLPDLIWELRPQSDKVVDTKWLSYALSKPSFRKQIKSIAGGSSLSMVNFSQEDFLSLPCSVPPVAEQKKIAEILSIWDEALSMHKNLLDKRRNFRNAIIQSLVVGKHRLMEEGAKSVTVGKIAREFSVRNTEKKVDEVLSCSKHRGFMRSMDFFGKQVFSKDLSSYKLIRRNMFGFPSNHIEEGSIGLQQVCDIGVLSPIYTVFETDDSKVNKIFFFAVLKSDSYRQLYQSFTKASVDRRGSLRWGDFSKLPVILPPISYQNRVALLISNVDEEIAKLNGLIDVYQKQKLGLMQKLLTGKIRVKV